MASLPIANDAAPQVAGEILLIPTAEIAIGDRLREIDYVWAEALGGVMAREGQQTPIEVCRLPGRHGWTLVAGAHRLTGARSIGMELIEAREVSSAADYRRMREASENLWRKGLDPLARAAHVAELVRLHKIRAGIEVDRDGRYVSAATRWQKVVEEEADDATATIASAYGWSEKVGAEIGISARTVRDDLALYRRIPAGLVAELRAKRHPVVTNAAQLKALAKLEVEDQRKAVAELVQDDPCATVGEAVARFRPGKPVPDAGAKRLSAFLGSFARMGLAERKAALVQLGEIMPAGYELVINTNELPDLIAFVEGQLNQGVESAILQTELERDHGATVQFHSGTYMIRLKKVSATCTAGGEMLLRAWLRAASRKLEAAA